jgi:hypothetical protein
MSDTLVTPACRPSRVEVPPLHDDVFTDGICHPALWLWDSWFARGDEELNLYCLALARSETNGTPITPAQRNDHSFHVRRFSSNDAGRSWRDRGAALLPGAAKDGSDHDNIWSGSAICLPEGCSKEAWLHAYTGISHLGPDRSFVQSLLFSGGTLEGPRHLPVRASSHPVRDREAIVAAGYYLPESNIIGANRGEEDGPILAWRDPFVFRDGERIGVLWSAKSSPRTPVIGHGTLKLEDGDWKLDLRPPIILPDSGIFTQAEVPKLARHMPSGDWLMLVSACDRLYENQPASEITKNLRLYRASTIEGPWRAALTNGPVLPGLAHSFGASFLSDRVEGNTLRLITPITENATEPLVIAPVRTVEVDLA